MRLAKGKVFLPCGILRKGSLSFVVGTEKWLPKVILLDSRRKIEGENRGMTKSMEIPYTICFCCYQQQALMLYRTFPPNAQLWNGLGGKIEEGETPLVSVQREMQEEADIDLSQAPSLFFAGIATWGPNDRASVKGMYAFIAHLSKSQAEQVRELTTPEGLITWKPIAWVCDPGN